MEKVNQEIVDMIDQNFGELLEQLKKSRGYSLYKISEKTNLSPSFIHRIIKGFRGCELSTKLNILINGFEMEKEVEEFLKRVVANKEALKKIND
ncbi:helix-turn-helix domain-containing protein [Evansella cellulosilytica]|uniref:HTH cro/C1-type domain-containing protein n=1 Tax=Evansella cellulosilytica (strain ATCC 21833 / DSM 2522 / FERM P-1141 / JCM 9156 / N-4) TaxID=649639 RepID=E6TU27_EVAC2|nr:helix-turn-helix transcriptional regulator [Evansella cellulosilytica]ADU28487.1 hypothetical protein Bcell_0198 [Evansella cellulosilytica DSM 2522]